MTIQEYREQQQQEIERKQNIEKLYRSLLEIRRMTEVCTWLDWDKTAKWILNNKGETK